MDSQEILGILSAYPRHGWEVETSGPFKGTVFICRNPKGAWVKVWCGQDAVGVQVDSDTVYRENRLHSVLWDNLFEGIYNEDVQRRNDEQAKRAEVARKKL